MANLPSVVVLTTEPPPLPRMATTGAGLRAWATAQGLRAAGHGDVTLVVAADAFAAQGGKVPPVPAGCPKVEAVPRAALREWFASRRPDVVVAQHWGLLRAAGPVSAPLAIDLAGPHLLERRLWGSKDPAADTREKLEALASADFTVCSGAAQRHYFIPYLLAAGHAAAPDLCPVIPFSVSPDLPTPAEDRDTAAFVFGGFFLPWQDPERPLRWLLEELDARDKGRLVFFGGMHPTLDVSRGRFESLLDHLEAHPRVERRGVAPFDEMVLTLRRCGVALDLFPRNLERELAFPSRTVVYLWAGVPVIHGNYDDLAPLLEQYNAGWTLDAGDEAGLKRLVGRLTGHSEDVRRRAEGAQRLARERLTWEKTIEPLAAWTRDPRPREGKREAMISLAAPERTGPSAKGAARGASATDLERAREECAQLREELERVRRGKVTQMARAARELSPLLAPFAFLLAALIGAALFLLFVAADAIESLTGRRPRAPRRKR